MATLDIWSLMAEVNTNRPQSRTLRRAEVRAENNQSGTTRHRVNLTASSPVGTKRCSPWSMGLRCHYACGKTTTLVEEQQQQQQLLSGVHQSTHTMWLGGVQSRCIRSSKNQ